MGAQYISLEFTKEFTPNKPPERKEMSTKLTAISIEKLALPATGRIDVYDDQVPGLVLRVSSTGTKSWSFTYRLYHKPKRLSLGGYPGVSLKLARERAREARGSVQRGEDPVARKKAEELDRQRNGFASCARDFVAKYCKPNLRTWSEVESAFERLAIPIWGDRPVKEIRRRDVVELLEVVAARTPYQANHLRAYLSRFFRWCIEREIIPEINPVTGVSRLIKPVARSRILSDAEIVALWRATEKLGGAFAKCCRILLLTGMRRDEAGLLRWRELDGDFACLPATRIKSNRDMKVALSGTAKAIVEGMPRFDQCDYVFTTNGKSPISGWSKAKDRITELMKAELGEEVPNWCPHDLRRTLASGLARLGYRSEIIKRVLGHAAQASDVTSIHYIWHNYDAEALEAIEAWAAHIAKLTAPEAAPAGYVLGLGENVMQLLAA